MTPHTHTPERHHHTASQAVLPFTASLRGQLALGLAKGETGLEADLPGTILDANLIPSVPPYPDLEQGAPDPHQPRPPRASCGEDRLSQLCTEESPFHRPHQGMKQTVSPLKMRPSQQTGPKLGWPQQPLAWLPLQLTLTF